MPYNSLLYFTFSVANCHFTWQTDYTVRNYDGCYWMCGYKAGPCEWCGEGGYCCARHDVQESSEWSVLRAANNNILTR